MLRHSSVEVNLEGMQLLRGNENLLLGCGSLLVAMSHYVRQYKPVWSHLCSCRRMSQEK